MSVKSALKKYLPPGVTRRISDLRARYREQAIGKMSVQDAFDEVYRKNIWKIGASPSGPGSEGATAGLYVELVTKYASTNNLRTAVDGGCGDFSVGSRLAPAFERYTALDASPTIIARNKQRYQHLTEQNVTFGVADMTSATFPYADLILIRQVLQHLTNAQIEKILQNLESSNWRRVLIAEEVSSNHAGVQPNLDLPSHTFRTRVALSSGVFIDKAPFNRPATQIATIEDVAIQGHPPSSLVIFELSRDTCHPETIGAAPRSTVQVLSQRAAGTA